tara:strand:+ start:2725 stop:2916 length:192 start_codon:yes stop_codon:yes gene_type:complete
MNPLWALLFKDKWRTPFSVYKMSLAEIVVLVGLLFGIGYGITAGASAIINSFTSEPVSIETNV